MPRRRPSKHAPRRKLAARASGTRQRLRLIDACISALHTHGPSETTVEKVVAIAGMSPGIIRFYFRSKAAMLVAALAYLAAEFEQRVMVPVAALRADPARALRELVTLYLDPDIASPRKVSVWYSFWGEASSRQEYLDICGKKDAHFAALVCKLVKDLIEARRIRHFDSAAIALGLIGVLEMLWQEIAFQRESQLNRPRLRRRAMAYLASVFPVDFGAAAPSPPSSGARAGRAAKVAPLHAAEEPWQVVASSGSLAAVGDYLTTAFEGQPAVLWRDSSGGVRAFRNSCTAEPHLLLATHAGHLSAGPCCAMHGLSWTLAGAASEHAQALQPIACLERHGLLWLCSAPLAAAGVT